MSLEERESIARELDPAFSIHRPAAGAVPVVFCSPHSGRIYPSALLRASQLQPDALRKSEDCFVDELFRAAPAYGATLIEAHFPRAYLDVNREPYELDPQLFDEPLPDYANARTMRVIGGLGTIARIVSDNEEIYGEPLSLSVAHERIERLYKPFHGALAGELDAARAAFGFAVLVDCHSMPSGSTTTSLPYSHRPDFVIGDRFGSACDPRIPRLIRAYLTRRGYKVQLNRPYAGGFITEHYGAPYTGRHAVQIEINRGLYLDERRFEPSGDFAAIRDLMTGLVAEITSQTTMLFGLRTAAE